MARIPPKTVSKRCRGAANLESDLKRLVFGQDKAIDALSRRSSWPAPACAT
jgi:ATP-dependent Clp protease ATP-binding subunit ClpA